MSGSQACRGSPHGPIEKEMFHLKAEKNKLNHSGCLLSQILFHCFVCLCICIFFSFYYPTLSLRGWVRKFCHRCYNFVNRHDRLLYYTSIERAIFLLYNDAKRMYERNKYFETDALKDTWGKTNGTFS